MHNLTIKNNENIHQQLLKNSNHNSFFQHLEMKLISQSQKLTQLMGKSLIYQNSHYKINIMHEVNREKHMNIRLKKEINTQSQVNIQKQLFDKIEKFYPERIRQICEKLKQSKIRKQQRKKSLEKMESIQKYLKNQKLKIRIKMSPPKLKCQKSVKDLQNLSKTTLASNEVTSLKDTISTQSCNSIKQNPEHVRQLIHSTIKLDDFEIIRYLSQNNLGNVYLVKHKVTNFICALKRINNFLGCKDQQLITQRIRQIKIQSFLDHPNIVQLYAIFVQDNDLYLLMELCFSGDLYNNLKIEKRFDEDKIKAVVKQICHAIEYMHDNDILHRDIKPQNIVFHENVTKICDFGCSVYSPLLRDTVCGTPLYSSPEIVQNQYYDSKVDIWNIGILTYQLLYGKPPYEIRSNQDLELIINSDIKFSKTNPASPEIKDFIMKCLQKNPKQRFNVIKLLKHEFLQQK